MQANKQETSVEKQPNKHNSIIQEHLQ